MEESDSRTRITLRNAYSVFSMSEYLLGDVVTPEIAIQWKTWWSIHSTLSGWLLTKILAHPLEESARVDEDATDRQILEWAMKLTALAEDHSNTELDISYERLLYLIYCYWLGNIIALLSEWLRRHLRIGIQETEKLREMEQLRHMLLQQAPKNNQQWHEVERQIDELSESWAVKTLSV